MLVKIVGVVSIPMLLDSMTNDAMEAYGARPERLYIVLNGEVVFQGRRGPYHYYTSEVEAWLQNYVEGRLL